MKNELKTLLSSANTTASVDIGKIQTTFELKGHVNRSHLSPYLGQRVTLIGTLQRYGQHEGHVTALIKPVQFGYGNLLLCAEDMTKDTVHHAWVIMPKGYEPICPVGNEITGIAEVIMYAKSNGSLSYGFKIIGTETYWSILSRFLHMLVLDVNQNMIVGTNPHRFVARCFIAFNKYIQDNKHLIQYSGLGLNKCKRVSDRLEKDLTQCATKYKFHDFVDSLASAIDQAEALRTNSN